MTIRSGRMSSQLMLQFMCPITGKKIDFTLPGETSVHDSWEKEFRRLCPHCRKRHRFLFKDGFLAASELEFATPLEIRMGEKHGGRKLN